MKKRAKVPTAKTATPVTTTEVVHIGTLRPDDQQAREHTPRGHKVLVEGMQRVGFGRSVVIDEDNVVRAGQGTIDAAAEIGLHEVEIVDAEPNELVVVRRTDLTGAARDEMAILDNRAGELSRWDPEALERKHAAGRLEGIFTAEQYAAELARLERARARTAAAGSTAGPAPSPGQAMRLVHVQVPAAEHEAILGAVRRLATRYGTDTLSDTVLRHMETVAAEATP